MEVGDYLDGRRSKSRDVTRRAIVAAGHLILSSWHSIVDEVLTIDNGNTAESLVANKKEDQAPWK